MYTLEQNKRRCQIYWIDGEKFKTNIFVFFFELPLQREIVTKVSLLAEILKQGTTKNPTPKDLAIASEEMYGAIWDISVVKKGEKQLLTFRLETVKMVPLADALSFFHELVLDPFTQEQKFPEEIVEKQKEILKRKLLAKKDNARTYSQARALEETAKNSPLALDADGYIEDLPQIDGTQLYAFYQDLLQQAQVKFFFVGDYAERRNITTIRKSFQGFAPLYTFGEDDFPEPKKPFFVQEHSTLQQGRLLLSFHTAIKFGEKKFATLLVFNQLLGGDGSSLLFQNLRETQGLCYDINSYLLSQSGYLFVQAGIHPADKKKAAKSIVSAIEELQKPISPDILAQAKQALLREYQTLADIPWGALDFCVEQVLAGGEQGLDIFLKQIEQVSAESIQHLAKKLRLCTIYLYAPKEEKIDAQ